MKPELGMCVGVTENPMGLVAYSDFLYEEAPFEPSFKTEIERSRKFMKSLVKTCDLKEMLPLLSKQKHFPKVSDSKFWNTFLAGPTATPQLPFNPAAVPYLRRITALQVNRVAIPMYHSIYLREDKI